MKRLSLYLMAVLLLGACQRDEAPDPGAEAPLESKPSNPRPVASRSADEVPVDALTQAIGRAINHPARPEEDRDRDTLRHPAEVLAFSGIGPGMCVLDLNAAGGWYTELLSHLVGVHGEVWAQNPPQFYERFGSADIDFRLADRRLPNVERQDRPMEDLALPPGRFDAVVAALVFHDLFWLTDDVPGVLSQLYTAMRPGAVMLVTDHNAPAGAGADLTMTFEGKHRIEDAFVQRLMEEAGFELVATSDVLGNPEDDRMHAFFEPEMRGKPTDRFVHLYRKPG